MEKFHWIIAVSWLLAMADDVAGQAAPTALPSVNSCNGNEKPIVVAYGGTKFGGTSGDQTLQDKSLTECSTACVENQGGQCAGFDYDTSARSCALYSSFDPATGQTGSSTAFYQKVCIDSSEGCFAAFQFEAIPQKILIGYAHDVTHADSPTDCLKQCLDSFASKSFECQSAMYYSDNQECILNTENRLRHPEVFHDETENKVVYFDNNCAGGSCISPSTTGYTKTADISLAGADGLTLPGKSFQACEWLCTHSISSATGSQLTCKSFLYSASDKNCVLFTDRLQPLGRASANPTPGTDYYEKGCYASKRTCRNAPTFTRYPQMILVGHAAYVVQDVPSITQCLDICLTPPPDAGADFKCMSVMYYYIKGDCILNTDTRENNPDVFTAAPDDEKADYFDIMCLTNPEICNDGAVPSSIRVLNAQITPNSNISLQESQADSATACRDSCYQLSPEKCRSFNFASGSSQCQLLLINSDSAFPTSAAGTDQYDLICIPTSGVCPEAAAFDRQPMKSNPGTPTQSLDAPTALPDCLATCIDQSCAGVNYNVFTGKCDLFSTTAIRRRRQTGQGLVDNPIVDWYANNCGPRNTGIETICTVDNGMKVVLTSDRTITGTLFAKMRFDTCRSEVKDSRMVMLTLGFPVEPKPNCDDESCGEPELPQPALPQPVFGGYGGAGCGATGCTGTGIPEKDCGVVDLKNGTYRATVILQTNTLGIPGLVTSMDQLYDVSCDFSEVNTKKYQATSELHVDGPTPAMIQPRGRIDIASPVVLRMTNPNGATLLQAQLGDTLLLTWQLMTLDDNLDFFVRRCVAEPGTLTIPLGKRGKNKAGGTIARTWLGPPIGATPENAGVNLAGGYGVAGNGDDCANGECLILGLAAHKQQQLPLIENGYGDVLKDDHDVHLCPAPSVSGKIVQGVVESVDPKTKTVPITAFRFDISKSVRIVCQLDICLDSCFPANCTGGQRSLGRKKRTPPNVISENDADEDDYYQTEHYQVPKQASAITTFVITDQKELEDSNFGKQVISQSAPIAERLHQAINETETTIRHIPQGSVCVPRTPFLGALVFITCLCLLQASAIAVILCRRRIAKQSR